MRFDDGQKGVDFGNKRDVLDALVRASQSMAARLKVFDKFMAENHEDGTNREILRHLSALVCVQGETLMILLGAEYHQALKSPNKEQQRIVGVASPIKMPVN